MGELGQQNIAEFQNLPDEPWDWEEISLNLLHPSGYLRAPRSSERKRYRLRWMTKPRAVPRLILMLQEESEREFALRMLSSFLYEKREENRKSYYMTALLLYRSCGTMTILVQELIVVYRRMISGNLTERAAMRLINVIILFQCIAAHDKTRQELIRCHMADLLKPLAVFHSPLEVCDNVRAVVLSVFGIICQNREQYVIQWAMESNILDICLYSMENGKELCIVIGLYILESILRDRLGLSWFLGSSCNSLRNKFLKSWESLVKLLVAHKCSWNRPMFHIIRCYILLCADSRGYEIVKETLPDPLQDGTFCQFFEEFFASVGSRAVWVFLRQLLFILGKQHSFDCPSCQRYPMIHP